MLSRRLIHITGVVQGVGYRPFIYQLATQYELAGSVCNDTAGVQIDVQGQWENIDAFIDQVQKKTPPLSRVDRISIKEHQLHAVSEFSIVTSDRQHDVMVSVAPDQAMCPDCYRELHDPTSPYYRYPFINCTNCGPRFTIIKQLPYDREFTSMANFALCPTCESAYHDPNDRRYHAQPVSCDHCGPHLSWFYSAEDLEPAQIKEHALQEAVNGLAKGGVIALKGIGGFHLACDATNELAVQRLRQLKHRQRKPLAIMATDLQTAQQLVVGESAEWQVLQSQAAPIVLMRRRDDGLSLARSVAPNMAFLGVMLPYSPLHVLLMEALADLGVRALVMTSANVSGVPLATQRDEIAQQFGGQLDGVLDHNREIVNACDDSVVHLAAGEIRVLRMARGFAPYSQACDGIQMPIIAVGAQQKSSVAFALPGQWMLSPYIGDIDDIDTQSRFITMSEYFPHLYQTQPKQWISDCHPGYFSTQFATEQNESVISLQHHYAHLLSVMAEHQYTKSVLGFAFDGTGWGEDETVWGGEVMVADIDGYQRIAQLKPFRLIGREQAIHQPARILYAMLLEHLSVEQIRALDLAIFKSWSPDYFDNLYRLWGSEKHSPYTSSIGRLFDGIAALLELVPTPDFEGESGLMMEQLAELLDHRYPNDPKAVQDCCYLNEKSIKSISNKCLDHDVLNASKAEHNEKGEPFCLPWNELNQLDWWPMLEVLIQDKTQHDKGWQSQVSAGFIDALAHAIVVKSQQYLELPVVLSGGVFQNRRLLNAVAQDFTQQGRQWMSGKVIPVNDGGIAAGQLWYGIHHQTQTDRAN